MAVNLSSLGGAGWQFFDNDGNPLSGGKLYSYSAGTTTPAITYMSSVGGVGNENTNPIILNSAGRPSSQIWLNSNDSYKFVLTDANDVVLWTMDNIPGISSFTTTTLADLPSLPASVGSIAFVVNPGREGLFICHAGTAPSDPLQGVYVSSNTGGFYWERDWDGVNGRVEWFGAVPNSSANDSTAAIQACIDLCPVTQLGAASYYIGTGLTAPGAVCLTINQTGRQIVGSGGSQFGTPGGSELVIQSSTASGIRVGYTAKPGGPETWAENIQLQDFTVRRNVAVYPVGNPSTGSANAPTGVILEWAAICKLNNVWTVEHSFGFRAYGTVACVLQGCRALRFTAGTAPGNDFFVGYEHDSTAASGYNSGNASTYYIHCGAFSNYAAGGNYTYNAGFRFYQGFTDTFLLFPETANCGYGMDLQGRSTTDLDWQTEDFICFGGVFDGARDAGVRITTTGPRTAVQIQNCYVGATMATGPASIGVYVFESHGAVAISNCQGIGPVGNPATGLLVENSSGVTSSNNIWTDFQDPIRLVNTTWYRIEDRINFAGQTALTAGVQVTNSSYGKIDCDIASSNPLFTVPAGVKLIGTSSTHVEIACTGIYPPSLAGGSANKLIYNNTQITSAGTFGTSCLASGIMS